MLFGVILLWTGPHSVEQRVVSLRMFLFFASALIAFSTPYLLFPDPAATLLQLGNVSRKDIMRHLAGRLNLFWAGGILCVGVICFGDLNSPLSHLPLKLLYFISGALFFSGLMMIAMYRYTKAGAQSQFWKESERGRELRGRMAEYFKFPLDPGSIPSLINTVLIGGGGMILVSVGALFYGLYGVFFELLPALFLVTLGFYRLKTLRPVSLTNYYASNAFFNEFFGETMEENQAASVLQADQLWWVPSPVKSHVWAMLLQLDRKLPAGRVLAVGHIVIWVLSYRDPSEQLMVSAWTLFALFHHVLIILSLSQRFAPGWFRRWVGSPVQWIFARAWMQFRWILLLGVSIMFNSLIFGHVSYAAQLYILAGYAGSALVISYVAHIYQTYVSEQFRV